MTVNLLTEHHFDFLSLNGGCTGSSESTLVKMPHCWKSHVMAQMINCFVFIFTDEVGSCEGIDIDESELPNTDYLKDIKHIKKEKRSKEKSKSKKDDK